MSEITRTRLDSRFINGLEQKIRPGWEEFEELAAQPAVQQFCSFESRYLGFGAWDRVHLDREFSFMRFDPRADRFEPMQAAAALERINVRLDDFLQGILTNYCKAKRMPVPEEDDIEAVGAIISKVLLGGVEKVHQYMDYGEFDNAYDSAVSASAQKAYLPVMLFMMGARLSSNRFYDEVGDGMVEANVPQAEIDEAIDTALQESCRMIQQNQKHPVPKGPGANDADRIYAGSMNALRSLYHQSTEKGFKTALFNQYIPIYAMPDMQYKNLDDPATRYDLQRRQFDAFAAHFNSVLGCDFSSPGGPALDRQIVAAYRINEEYDRDDQRYFRSVFNVLNKMGSAHATHHFVDGIADGSIKYSEVMRAMMQLRKQPLVGYEVPEIDINKMWVNWEMLPPGLIEPGEMSAPPDNLVEPQDPRERDIDWRRIARLVSYAISWGPEASFARTKISNLPEDKQYYAVILPQQEPDGTILEHAIADHPEQGHGLYMWRAERGRMRDPGDNNRNLTWREVLAHERMIARQLGARCLYHTKNLEINVLDYLTAPPESLLQHRYSVGRGAVRMARLARDIS